MFVCACGCVCKLWRVSSLTTYSVLSFSLHIWGWGLIIFVVFVFNSLCSICCWWPLSLNVLRGFPSDNVFEGSFHGTTDRQTDKLTETNRLLAQQTSQQRFDCIQQTLTRDGRLLTNRRKITQFHMDHQKYLIIEQSGTQTLPFLISSQANWKIKRMYKQQ